MPTIGDLNEGLLVTIEKAVKNLPQPDPADTDNIERICYIAGTVDQIKHYTKLWGVDYQPYVMYLYHRIITNGTIGRC